MCGHTGQQPLRNASGLIWKERFLKLSFLYMIIRELRTVSRDIGIHMFGKIWTARCDMESSYWTVALLQVHKSRLVTLNFSLLSHCLFSRNF